MSCYFYIRDQQSYETLMSQDGAISNEPGSGETPVLREFGIVPHAPQSNDTDTTSVKEIVSPRQNCDTGQFCKDQAIGKFIFCCSLLVFYFLLSG